MSVSRETEEAPPAPGTIVNQKPQIEIQKAEARSRLSQTLQTLFIRVRM